MPVQDNEREKELCNLFNLHWDPDHDRGGTDAIFEEPIAGKPFSIPVEVKSTTSDTVSTARDVGMDHIKKWRGKLWIFGFYSSTPGGLRLNHCLCLTPDEMEPWIQEKENYIRPDFLIGQRAAAKLTLQALHAVCGRKARYTISDAKTIQKRQWSAQQYRAELDTPKNNPTHYTPAKMLGILRQRALYVHERGATLNNPHIPKNFLNRFTTQHIISNHARHLREKLSQYLASNSAGSP